MRCWVRKVAAGSLPRSTPVLIPVDHVDEAEFEKLRPGVDLRADVVQPRNPGLHRKAFALLNLVWPHTNYPTVDILRKTMTIGAGFVDELINPMTGEVSLQAKSWEFAQMDNIEFEELFNRLVDVAIRLLGKSSRDDWPELEQEIARF
jgi:hypothetical protein